jgi:ABC-type uncharacterized transport system permease subunit
MLLGFFFFDTGIGTCISGLSCIIIGVLCFKFKIVHAIFWWTFLAAIAFFIFCFFYSIKTGHDLF